MLKIIYNTDITTLKVDAIVNASNGIGYMGGFLSRNFKCNGLAERINYKTNGQVERECHIACKKHKLVPRWLSGYNSGEVFSTTAYNLPCRHIIHAVTMKYPGIRSNIKTIQCLCPNIIEKARYLNCKTIAIPMLGTGIGKLKQEEVLCIFETEFASIEDIDITIIIMK